MIRVVELAIISIVLVAAAVLGFMYLKSMLKIGHEATKLKTILNELENTFILLRPVKYRVCLNIAGIEVKNSTILLDNKIIIIEHAVKIYIGSRKCTCTWYSSWLCFNIDRNCGIIDLSRLSNRYYIIGGRYLCGYVNTWIEKMGNMVVVHIAGG